MIVDLMMPPCREWPVLNTFINTRLAIDIACVRIHVKDFLQTHTWRRLGGTSYTFAGNAERVVGVGQGERVRRSSSVLPERSETAQ
jgi:hypothetical protein